MLSGETGLPKVLISFRWTILLGIPGRKMLVGHSLLLWYGNQSYSQRRRLLFNRILYMVRLNERCNPSQCVQNKEMWSGFNIDHQTDVILTLHNSAKNFLSSISRISCCFFKEKTTHTLVHILRICSCGKMNFCGKYLWEPAREVC